MIGEVRGKSISELQLQHEIRQLQNAECPIILFGAGCTSEFIVEQMNSLGIFPQYFCDNDRGKAGKSIAGLEVVAPDSLAEKRNSYFYITTQLFYREIREQLVNMGIDEARIMKCDLIYQFPWEKQIIPYLEENEDSLEDLYDRLQDMKSKLVLKNRLAFLVTRKREYMSAVHDDIQYFDGNILNLKGIKNYIDIGTYTGDTIIQFCKLNNTYENIWGFEPDAELYQTANENLKGYRGITIVPSATSDFDGTMQVESQLGVMQTIDNQYSDSCFTGKTFDVCKLDTYFAGCDLDGCFVKMDIEGAELATLKGMEEFIVRNAPTLAICVYHKLEDIIEIPRLLDSYNVRGGYKYYLRHYSDNQTETVLFAKMEDK